MTLKFSDDFNSGSPGSYDGTTFTGASSVSAINGTAALEGANGWHAKVVGGEGGTNYRDKVLTSGDFSATGKYCIKFRLKVITQTINDGVNRYVWNLTSAGPNVGMQLRYEGTRYIQRVRLLDGSDADTNLSTSPSIGGAACEVKQLYDGSGANPVIKTWIDGTLAASYTDTSSGTLMIPHRFQIGPTEAAATATADLYIDDIRVYDTDPDGGGSPTVPGAPTIGAAVPGNTQASVAFTPPASDGGSTITGYTATSTPGSLTASGASSPLVVTGLTNGTSYTFTVHATNVVGNSSESSASNSVIPAAPAAAATWSQDNHDAQRTGWGPTLPSTPWQLAGIWNGADSAGGAGGHGYHAPREGRICLSPDYVYVPAGDTGLFALNKATLTQAWTWPFASVSATPAYHEPTDTVIVGTENGRLIRFDAGPTRDYQADYWAGSPIRKAVLVVGAYAYCVCEDGSLHKVTVSTMASVWVYRPTGAPVRAQQPPAYSATADGVVYVTSDFYVHLVSNSAGTATWRVKPTSHVPSDGDGYTFEWGWPVVADVPGVVLVRMSLATSWLDPGSAFPTTNSAIRTYLNANPGAKNLFAMSLTDGSAAFVPAVGYGSVEAWNEGGSFPTMGSLPVVVTLGSGKQVAYIHRRCGDNGSPDFRWDSEISEMVLDGATVSGLSAGDCRTVKHGNFNGMGGIGYSYLTDEQCPITVLGPATGPVLVHTHWAGAEPVLITDRSDARAGTFADPIATSNLPPVMFDGRSVDIGTFQPSHFILSGGVTMVTDSRGYSGPMYWGYYGVEAPPGAPVTGGYSAGTRARYTVESDGILYVEGNGGEVLAFRHAGTGTTLVAATALDLSGPSGGAAGVASDPITVKLAGTGPRNDAGAAVTLSDGGAGGAFTPSSVTLDTRGFAQNVTYTPASGATPGTAITLTASASGLTSDTLTYTVSGGSGGTTVVGGPRKGSLGLGL